VAINKPKRLITNTLVNYSKLGIVVLLTLVTHRVLLEKLGVVQYGVLAGLSSIGMFSSMFGAALLSAAHRNLAYEMGRRDDDNFRAIISLCQEICLILAVIFGLIIWAFKQKIFSILGLSESFERAYFYIAGYFIANLLAGPANAVFIAKQQFSHVALMQIVLSIVTLMAALTMDSVGFDPLNMYTATLLVSQVCITGFATFISHRNIINGNKCFGLYRAKGSGVIDLIRFFLWNLLSHAASYVRMHGALLASFAIFGAASAAAFEIGNKIANLQRQAGYSVGQAVQPVLAYSSGREAEDKVRYLALTSSKFSFLAAMLITAPVMVDAEGLLWLWLGDYPEYAPLFARLLGMTVIIGYLADGHALASVAKGNIATPSLISCVSQITIVSAVILYVVGIEGAPVWYIPASGILSAIVSVALFVLIIGAYMSVSIKLWFGKVFLPAALVSAFSITVGLLCKGSFANQLVDLVATFLSTVLAVAITAWAFALSAKEKNMVRSYLPSNS
jgi:Na+-driven multidrug efflux pump